MIKKKYLNPTIQIVQLKHQCQILAGSLQSVKTTGLGEDDLGYDDDGGDQSDAW